MGWYLPEMLLRLGGVASTGAGKADRAARDRDAAGVEPEAAPLPRDLARQGAALGSARLDALLRRRMGGPARRLWSREDGFTMAGPRR
jgi:hypothetical protein